MKTYTNGGKKNHNFKLRNDRKRLKMMAESNINTFSYLENIQISSGTVAHINRCLLSCHNGASI